MRPLVLTILFLQLLIVPAWPEDTDDNILLIGVDGAEWKIIDNLLEEGRLPHIRYLIANGVRGKLQAIPPLISPAIWTEIITGKSRKKHGVLEFTSKLPETNVSIPVSSNMRKTNALWNILGNNSKSAGIVGWWATWPAEKVNGFIVSDRFCYQIYAFMNQGLSAREMPEYQVFPQDILSEIIQFVRSPQKEIMGLFDVDFPDYSDLTGEEIKKLGLLSSAYSRDKTYAETGLCLWGKLRPDFFAIYFDGTDTASHLFWGPNETGIFDDIIPGYYEYIDEEIGRFMQIAGNDCTIIICSDHGFGPASREYREGHPVLPDPTGSHRETAVLIISGKNIKRGLEISGATVLDIAPTILYLMGIPVAEDMDGKILLEAISEDYRKNNPIKSILTYENTTGKKTGHQGPILSPYDEIIKERLRSLGYIQ